MKLTYRGAQYHPQSIGYACVATGETGTYRGRQLQFKAPPIVPAVSGFSVLSYRRAQYRKLRYQAPNITALNEPIAMSLQINQAEQGNVPALLN